MGWVLPEQPQSSLDCYKDVATDSQALESRFSNSPSSSEGAGA